MLLKCSNLPLIQDREKTYLTAAVAAAATTLTVKAITTNTTNTDDWADNDYIIIGEIGTKNAEIMQLSGAPSDGTSITIDRLGSAGGTRFTHNIDEPVYRIAYNQVEFSNAATIGGAKTVTSTEEVQPDELFTRYEDTANTTGFGFVRFYNSTGANFSTYSVGIPYTGYPAKALFRMIRNVRRLLNLTDDDKAILDDDIIDELNEKQRDVYHERLWSFAEEEFSFSSVANTSSYAQSTRIAPGQVFTLLFDSQPLVKLSQKRWEMAHFDSNSAGDPTHCCLFRNRIKVYPIPSSAATTTTLNGAITDATATSITLTSTSSLRAPGRIVITADAGLTNTEVISYDAVSSTQILGCQRGLEGTTAATHLTLATVTERDFIGTGKLEPDDLVDMNDETGVPDPRVLESGAAMELALSKLNDQVLHDRLKIKYGDAVESLRDKFGRKMTGSFFGIGDKDDYPSDQGGIRNPNEFRELS